MKKIVFSHHMWTSLSPFEPIWAQLFFQQVECSFQKTEDKGKRNDIGINLVVSVACSTILSPFDPDWASNLLSAASQKSWYFLSACELVWAHLSPIVFSTGWMQFPKNRGQRKTQRHRYKLGSFCRIFNYFESIWPRLSFQPVECSFPRKRQITRKNKQTRIKFVFSVHTRTNLSPLQPDFFYGLSVAPKKGRYREKHPMKSL